MCLRVRLLVGVRNVRVCPARRLLGAAGLMFCTRSTRLTILAAHSRSASASSAGGSAQSVMHSVRNAYRERKRECGVVWCGVVV